jgi:hypothetical protein
MALVSKGSHNQNGAQTKICDRSCELIQNILSIIIYFNLK